MLKRIVVLLLFVQVSFGQTKEGVELCLEYQKIVSGFNSEKEANEALDKILNVIGASKNFTLIPCDNINNALAITFKSERYILFDSEFMNQITQLTNDWSSIFILAHEVGHHINGHTREALLISVLDDITLEKKRQEELEADEFASFILAKLGASYSEIEETIDLIASNEDDLYSTHPSKNKRIAAIKTGYYKAKENVNNNSKIKTKVNDVIVNSNWKYKYFSRRNSTNTMMTWVVDDYIYESELEGKPLDPFEIKDLEKLIPLSWKKIEAIGVINNNSNNNNIFLTIDKKKYKSIRGITFDKLSQFSDLYVKYFPYTTIDIKIEGLLEQPKIQKISPYQPIPTKDQQLPQDQYPMNEEGIISKFEYVVDDLEPGFFTVVLEGFSEPRRSLNDLFKRSIDDIAMPLPIRIIDSHNPDPRIYGYWFNTNSESEERVLIAIQKFLNQIKNGNKLYVRIGREIFDKKNEIWMKNYDFETYTYVFDLTGSSKALSF